MSDMHAAGKQIDEHLEKLRVDMESLKNVPGVDRGCLRLAENHFVIAELQLKAAIGRDDEPRVFGNYALTPNAAAYRMTRDLDISVRSQIVHILAAGETLCGLGAPPQWPAGDVWVRIEDRAEANCAKCLRAADQK